MTFYNTAKCLNNENIENTADELTSAYLKTAKRHSESKLKFRMTVEELMFQFREFYGEDTECRISGTKFLGKYYIELSCSGERKEWAPYDEDTKLSHEILTNLGVVPHYAYSAHGKNNNRLIWELEKTRKSSLATKMLIAVVLAVITGIIINRLPAGTHDIIANELLTPIFSKFIAVITTLATPLVFFAVICGIVDIGDTKSLGKIGSKILTRMSYDYLFAGLLLGIGSALFYGASLVGTAEQSGSGLGQIVQLVLDIVPDNLFRPFAQDNDLQIIVISIFVGVCLLLLGDRVSKTKDIIKEVSALVNKMMMVFSKCLPIIVYLGVSKLILDSHADQFISIAKMMLLFIVINIVFMLYMTVRVHKVTGISMIKLFPKQLSTLMINLTTSSQVTALPENMKCCKQRFGIDTKAVDFGLPLGIVVYMPSGATMLGITAYALCASFGVEMTLGLLIRIVIVSIIVAIAAPPIPGSAFVVLPIMFTACGIPAEAFPIALIYVTIVGYILPAMNGFNLQLELLMSAKKLGMVDEEILKTPLKELEKV